MRRRWIAALMAAAALVPGMAAAQDRGGGRGQGGWQQRQGNSDGGRQRAAPQSRPDTAPQRQNNGSNRTWQQRPQAARTEAGREFRQERRDDRRTFAAERQRDRQALTSGAVTRDAYRADRNRDAQAFRQDRREDQRDFSRDRRNEVQRSWSRSGADWNDHGRDQARRSDWNDQRRWYGGNDRGYGRGDWRGDGRGGWNRDWRRDQRYDWNRWRYANRNVFRLPRYYAPYGWNYGYRRFAVGAVMSSMLFAQSYWINDPWAYRLPDAYGDYRWVRYYNDALLVDVYSGEVVDVIHDIFW